jgi:hypothetical protein
MLKETSKWDGKKSNYSTDKFLHHEHICFHFWKHLEFFGKAPTSTYRPTVKISQLFAGPVAPTKVL